MSNAKENKKAKVMDGMLEEYVEGLSGNWGIKKRLFCKLLQIQSIKSCDVMRVLLGVYVNILLYIFGIDIFNLDYMKIQKLDGWGNLSINNLKRAINKSKNISLEKFIFSIGIRHIGQENAKILADFFVSIHEFSKLFENKKRVKILQNLVELDGIGNTQIEAIDNFFSIVLAQPISQVIPLISKVAVASLLFIKDSSMML